jgi:hypothetical protein
MDTKQRKRQIGFRWGITAAALVTATTLACDLRSDSGPSVNDIDDWSDRFYGKTVSLSGEVDEVYSAKAFMLEGHGLLWDEEIPVLTSKEVRFSGDKLKDDTEVVVSGKVHKFVVADIERALGWDLDPSMEAELKDEPVLIADSIRRVNMQSEWTQERPEEVIISYTAIVSAPEPKVLTGRSLDLQNVPFQGKTGKGAWFGNSLNSHIFVLPGDDVSIPDDVDVGQLAHIEGTVKSMPEMETAIEKWGLDKELRAQLKDELTYLHATSIEFTEKAVQDGG